MTGGAAADGKKMGKAAIAGWVLTVIVAGMLLMSAVMKITLQEAATEGLSVYGWTSARIRVLGIVEAACAVVFLVPRTAGLGAVLVTGYLGGAVATHAQFGEADLVVPVVLGAVAWLALWLRDARVRGLLPLRG